MSFKMKPFRAVVFVVVVFFSCATCEINSEIKLNYFTRRYEMDNKIDTNGMLQEMYAKTRFDCISRCRYYENCFFAFYNHDKRQCRLYKRDIGLTKTGDENGWLGWGVVDCGRPDKHISNGYAVEYTDTSYLSTANVQCGLGQYSDSNGQSVCQGNGQWSDVSLSCQAIPKLMGTKALTESSGSGLECRTLTSGPVGTIFGYIGDSCNEDEILTGCSKEIDPLAVQIQGTFLMDSSCKANGFGAKSVARCCKIPGLQCEYIQSANRTASVSCYKNFQLLDCSCTRWPDDAGPCPTTMTNNTCLGDQTVGALRYAVCCYHGNLSCYVMTKSGQDVDGSGQLIIACRPGEIMTACSGFNSDEGVQAAIITKKDGIDKCQIHPGNGTISTLVGYISCCQHNKAM